MREVGSGIFVDEIEQTGESQAFITAIVPQRRRGRVSVFVDEEFAVGLDEGTLLRLGWQVGQPLPPRVLEQAREQIEFGAALASAEVLLGYRGRSEAEIRERLQRKGYSPATAEAVLRRLQADGYINDTAFAEDYAASASSRRIGRRRVAADLRRKGVAPSLAAEAAAGLDPDKETASALAYAGPRAARMGALDRGTRERRLSAAMERRGFSYSTIRTVLRQLENLEGGSHDSVSEDPEQESEL